jgi:hypothetical protein
MLKVLSLSALCCNYCHLKKNQEFQFQIRNRKRFYQIRNHEFELGAYQDMNLQYYESCIQNVSTYIPAVFHGQNMEANQIFIHESKPKT